MLIVPLASVPSQSLTCLLGGQNCQINVYQKSTGLYLDLAVNDAPIVSTIIAVDRTLLVRESYLGFIGDIAFFDTQGYADPQYTGLGARWLLAYLTAADLAV
jgi:hypothetical protein